MKKSEFYNPDSIIEALQIKRDTLALPFAGGTDLMVRKRAVNGGGTLIKGPVLFLNKIKELRRIELKAGKDVNKSEAGIKEDVLIIGSGVTLSEILLSDIVPDILRKAVSEMSAPAVRNIATIGGNICNASPAGDTLPPLYVLDAILKLQSIGTKNSGIKERIVPVEDFIIGPGKTTLKNNELLTEIFIPLKKGDEKNYYRKIGTRKANALSKLSIAVLVDITNEYIKSFAAAFGAVAPVVVRSREIEKSLIGKSFDNINIERIWEDYSNCVKPINDQRSTALYRKNVLYNLFKECLRF